MENLGNKLEAANDNAIKKEMSTTTFLNNFTRDYVEKRPSTIKNQLIEEVMNRDNLSGTLAWKGLAEFRASDEKYNEIALDKIDVYMLRKQLAKWYMAIRQSRENLQKHILREYDVSAKDFDGKLRWPITSLWVPELNRLISNDNELQKFLKSKLSRDSVKLRAKFDLFDGLSQAKMQERFRGLWEEDKKEIQPILLKINNGKNPREDEVRAIIESSLLDETQKILFVHTFLPFITLQQAVDISLLSQGDAESKKKSYLQDIFNSITADNDRKNELINQISLSDIKVETKDIVSTKDQVIRISENIWFQDYADLLSGQNEDYLNQARIKWPSSFEDMVALIGDMNENNRFENLQFFAPWNIIKFSNSWAEEGEINYVKIESYDDIKKQFSFRSVGWKSLDLSTSTNPESLWYLEFIESLKKHTSTWFEAIHADMIDDKIQSWNIQASTLQTLSSIDFEGVKNEQRKNEIKQKEREEINLEIAEKKSQLSLNEDTSKKWELEQEISRLETRLHTISTTDLTSANAAEIYNRVQFLEKLNEIDPDWMKLWFKKWVAFTTGKKMWEIDSGTYTLVGNPDYEAWTVSFYSQANGWKLEITNLTSFLETFKEKWAKRVLGIQSPEDLITSNPSFSKYEFSGGVLILKDAEDLAGKKADREAKFLWSGTNDTIVQINSFSGGFVYVQVWERKEVGREDLKKDEESADIIKIKWAPKQKWTLDELNRFIKENTLKPDWKIWENLTIIPKDQQNKIKRGFKFNAWSIYEVIAGWKTVVEGIKESLSTGSHVKSAHAALAMWKFLPGELRDDLQAKVEAAESEEMDKALKQLGAVDSWIAVERIKKWLKNRSTSEAKKEAGLLFMLEKYGHLTSKKDLYPYRWKFLWYESFGGQIWDALYLQVQREVEEDGQVFSEEKLMHTLLKKQCWWHWFNGIHRRSRLHKDYENKWKEWVKAEFEKGEKDASNYRNSKSMVREGMGEALWGTTSNAFGFAKKAVGRGGSLQDMMHIPSAILLSWAAFDLDQVTYDKVNALWGAEGQPVITFRMYGSQALMNLYNNTVWEISKEIGKAYSQEFPNIVSEAKALQKMSENRDEPEGVRLKAADKFWKKYGEVLSRSLNMSLEWDTKYGATDNLIRRKKDDPRFSEYYKTVRWAVGEWKSFANDYVDDWVGWTGIFGLNPYAISLKFLNIDQGGGFREKSIAPKVWDKYVRDINSTKHKLFIPGKEIEDPENRLAQEEYLADLLQDIIGAFYEMWGLRTEYIFGLNNPTSTVWNSLNKWGFNLQRDIGVVSSVDILNGSHKDKFRSAASKIISGRWWNSDRIPEVLMRKIQNQTAANLNRKD